MSRTFDITGPCEAGRQYLLPPEARLPDLEAWVEERLTVEDVEVDGKTLHLRGA